MAGKGGGAWKVAYADFVTAMMAFFLVMWITSQDAEMREAVSHYFQDPFGTGEHHEPGSTSIATEMKHRFPGVDHKQLGGHDRHRGDAGPDGVPLTEAQAAGRMYHKNGTSDLGVSVLFDGSSAELTPRAQQQLEEIVPALVGKMHRLEIRGHTSRRPLPEGGPYGDSWQLCYARCLATMDYLVQKGVEPERFRLSQSAGHEPLFDGPEPQSLRYNSRVEVMPLPELIP